jgi:hypothetical protein
MGVSGGGSERMTVETGEERVEVGTRSSAISCFGSFGGKAGELFKPTPASMPLHSTYATAFRNRLNLGVAKDLAPCESESKF